MFINDDKRPRFAMGLLLIISLAFVVGRLATGHFTTSPKHEEAAAIQAYRQGDTNDALPIFQQLARKGDATAAYYLGEMYQYGDGTARNGELAKKWLTQSAQAGHVAAARQLGLLYLNGTDPVQDLVAARHWLQTAARHHDAIALRHLGDMEAQGFGAPANPVSAYADYAAAAVLGDAYAANQRDTLATGLSTEQQVAGRHQAETLVATARKTAPQAGHDGAATPAPAKHDAPAAK